MKREIYFQWHLTYRCENRCQHCYQDKQYKGEEVTLKQADFILEQLKQFSQAVDAEPYIVLTGGNPMMNPNFWQILEKCKQYSSRIGILGNPEPIVYDEKVVSKLKEIGIDSYQVSLDGMEKTHDKWRRKGSFIRTITAIEILRANGIWVNVMSTVSRENYLEMFLVMRTVYSAGASFWTYTRYCPPQGGDCGISAKKYFYFMSHLLKELKPYELNGAPKQSREPLFCTVKGIDHPEKLSGCGVGFSRMALLPDNTLMACRRHPGSVLGKVTEEHSILWHFVENPKMKFYRDFSNYEACQNCTYLKYCRGCRAAAYLYSGKEKSADPQCVKIQMRKGGD